MERARRLDTQRINDLESIASSIDQYYNNVNHSQLPASLDELKQERNIYIGNTIDPETGSPYGYARIGDTIVDAV